MRFILTFLIIPLVSWFYCDQAQLPRSDMNKPDIPLVNYSVSLTKLIDSLRIDKSKTSILITKSQYKLAILYNKVIIKSYPVVFGFNPVDDKFREGDGCTPEGTFGVKAKYPHKSWNKFIWIDYPNATSWNKHTEAKKHKKITANAKIGGDVGIHGVPSGDDFAIDQKQNWTLGCISLKNKDIDEVYALVTTSTRIEILH